jgi:hypothetical protein
MGWIVVFGQGGGGGGGGGEMGGEFLAFIS